MYNIFLNESLYSKYRLINQVKGYEMIPKTSKGYAECTVKEGWGYSNLIFNSNGEIIDEYEAGDCIHDSQVYSTGQLKADKLTEYARQTAQEMLDENGIDGDIIVLYEKA